MRPLALGCGDGVEQFHAALLDLGGEIFERGEVGAGLFLARAQRLDLLARIGDALLPQLLFRADRLQALLAEPHLALETFKRGFGAGRGLAARSGFHLCGFECGFQRREGSKREQRRRDAASMPLCLIEPGSRVIERFGQRAELLAGRLRLVLGRGDLIARTVELGMRLLGLLPQRLGLEPRRFRLGDGSRKLGLGLGGAGLAPWRTPFLSAASRLRSTSRAPAALAVPAWML